MPRLKVFVARRWDETDNTVTAVNNRIIELIERAGMEISKEMDKTGLDNIELKEAMNICDVDGFCVIITPRDGNYVPANVDFEIKTAKNYQVPSFVFVERAYMGDPTLQQNVKNIVFGLSMTGQWFEFNPEKLLGGDEDKSILDFLGEMKSWLEVVSPETRMTRDMALAALFGAQRDMAPFQIGLQMLADAYDQDPSVMFDHAAEAAARITGARFGFVGLLEPNPKWSQLKLTGFWGLEQEDKDALQSLELGFDDQCRSKGITGYVACTQEKILEGKLSERAKQLKNEKGIDFVDPGDMGIESELCVPILLRDRCVGVIDVEHTAQNKFKSVHRMILEWLSRVVALVYSGDQLEGFMRELGAVAREGGELRQPVLDALARWSQADFGFIGLIDRETGDCVVRVAYRVDRLDEAVRRQFEEGSLVVPDKGLTGKVLKSGKAEYVSDISKAETYETWWRDTKSEAALPIIHHGEIRGVVNLEYRRPQAFKSIDKTLFESIACLLPAFTDRR